jgi:subtilase family serine protease
MLRGAGKGVSTKDVKRSFLVRLCLLLASLQAISGRAANERQSIGGVVPKVVPTLQPVGRLEGSQRLKLAIGVAPRDEQGLDTFIQEVYDPASPNYHSYLAPGQFVERFGPTEQDYQALIDYAKASGLNVTRQYSNRVVLDVEGAVTNIEKALQVTLRTYQHPTESRTFYAPDVEPSLALGVRILHIEGLDNYTRPHPKHTRHLVDQNTPKLGSAPSGQLWGNDFRDAYVPGTTLTGAGQSVGLVELEGFYPQDITDYENAIGMSVNNRPQLVVVTVDSAAVPNEPGGDNGEECSLDIEIAVAMAPGLSNVYVFEDGDNNLSGNIPFDHIFEKMVDYPNVLQFSCSWGGTTQQDPTAETLFKQMAAQGQSFFDASGDGGAFVGTVEFPSDSPNITQVGGTTLTDGGGPSYPWESEVVWDAGSGPRERDPASSSGGISTYYAIPSWQAGISMTENMGSTTMRNTPDVAANANNCYLYTDDGQASGGWAGTSCAAPLWAAFTALVNQQAATNGLAPVGFLNPALYALASGTNYASYFHDITSGNNTWEQSPGQFYAAPGYDLCCGLGTMTGTNLINALVSPVPLYSFVITSCTLTNEPCTNGAINPGETVNVNVALKNIGANSTTNLVATLLSYLVYRDETAPGVVAPADVLAEMLATNAIAFPSGPVTIGPLAPGATTTNEFSFFADGTCEQTITFVLQLQDGPANLGNVITNFHLGGSNANCSSCSPTNVSVTNIVFPTNGYNFSAFAAVVVVTGQAPTNATVTIFDNGVSNMTVMADDNGIYAAVATLTFGSNALMATPGATTNIFITLAPPILQVAPVVNSNVSFSGVGAPGATVFLYEGDSTNGTPLETFIITNASGDFSGTILLPLGNITLTATEMFEGQTSTNASPRSISVVPTPPPTIISPYDGWVGEREAQTITGTGVAGAILTVFDITINATNTLATTNTLGTTTVNRAGRCSVAVKLANGINTLFAVQELNGIAGPPSDFVVVTDDYLAPVILFQPVNQTNFLKGSVTFSAEVLGALPIRFAWWKNGVKIPGATTEKLTLANLDAADTNYSYHLTASNAYRGVTSIPVTLTLVTNPFTNLAGAYYGLFTKSPAQFESSGLLTLNLTDLGKFTARILNAGGSYSFSGSLSGVGWWSNLVSRGAALAPLTVVLDMNVTNGLDQIFGTVSDGTNWSADLEADRAAYSHDTPSPNQGKYTLVFGDTNTGAGYGTASVSAAGMVSLRGVLSDNTSVAPGAVSVSTNGRWPLYIPLYGRNGSLVSWINFTNNGASIVDLTNTNGAVCSFVGSNAMWFRTNADGRFFYPDGFTNVLTVAGSAFSPDNNESLLGSTSLAVILSGGDGAPGLASGPK